MLHRARGNRAKSESIDISIHLVSIATLISPPRYAREPLRGALLILGHWIIGDGTSPFVKITGDGLDRAVRLRPSVGAETDRGGAVFFIIDRNIVRPSTRPLGARSGPRCAREAGLFDRNYRAVKRSPRIAVHRLGMSCSGNYTTGLSRAPGHTMGSWATSGVLW
jgi:hypothetical protein